MKKNSDNKLRSPCLRAFQHMLMARVFEEKMAKLYRAGRVPGGVYMGKGQEALSAAFASQLDAELGDIYAPLIRDQAGRLAFGESLFDAARTYLGSATGPMRGIDGNVHRGRFSQGILPMISHLGAMIAPTAGALFSRKMDGREGMVGVASVGDGATSTGAFHEALNLASVEGLPLIVVVANNKYAYSTPNSLQFACKDLCDRAVSYGAKSWKPRGNDLISCVEVAIKCVAEAREHPRVQLVVGEFLRLSGHGEHDDAKYISFEDRKNPLAEDCIKVARRKIIERDWLSEEEIDNLEGESGDEVDVVVNKVLRESEPNPEDIVWSAV